MTDAQRKVRLDQMSASLELKNREFRKKCVTQGIVMFVKQRFGFYKIKYREHFVCYLFKDKEDDVKLRTMWNIIKIAEETIEKIEGVINDRCTMESQMCTVI